MILFAPLYGDFPQGFVAESVPRWFDVAPLKRALEAPECPGAVDGKLKILADIERGRGWWRLSTVSCCRGENLEGVITPTSNEHGEARQGRRTIDSTTTTNLCF